MDRVGAVVSELASKLRGVRVAMEARALGAVRLRGVDWFAWATCGGSSMVLLAAETGVAEVLITRRGAWVLTDEIERDRLMAEELPPDLEVIAAPWQTPGAREASIQELKDSGAVASDLPRTAEVALPPEIASLRSSLGQEEQGRYRALGRDAAEVATDVLSVARPDWTDLQLAGAASEALWRRGIRPALVLVGNERRLPLYRHPTPCGERLGARAMLVLCAWRQGLVANLTRFVSFRCPSHASTRERLLNHHLGEIEAAALDASRPGTTLGQVYARLVGAYREAGYPREEDRHHQGGTCGYRARDQLAQPGSDVPILEGGALAWNPSLPGAKLEDTVLVGAGDVEPLTVDPRWPTFTCHGRARPEELVP